MKQPHIHLEQGQIWLARDADIVMPGRGARTPHTTRPVAVLTSDFILKVDPQQPTVLIAPLSTQMDYFDKYHDVTILRTNHPRLQDSRIVLSLLQPVRKDLLVDFVDKLTPFEIEAVKVRLADIFARPAPKE